MKAARRAAALTQQLLAFSRRQVLQPQESSMSTRRCETSMRCSAASSATTSSSSSIWIRASIGCASTPGQLDQVVMNLVMNPATRCRRAARDGDDRQRDAGREGRWRSTATSARAVRVVDGGGHGAGMDAATAKRAFEPFFTTKPTGQGHGPRPVDLYGIVKQSGGYVWVNSEPGRGTRVSVVYRR